MGFTQRISWETLRSLDSATFNGTYKALGTPLANPAYIAKLVNNSNVIVTISIDGTNDVDVAPAGSYWLYDEGKVGRDGAFPALPKNTQVFVKGAVGTGLVYLAIQYIVNAVAMGP